MATLLPGGADALTRGGTYLDPALDWTFCGWFWLSADYAFIINEADLILFADGAFSEPYLLLYAWVPSPGTVLLAGQAGIAPSDAGTITVPIASWFHGALRYKSATNELTVVRNGVEAGDVQTPDLSTMPAQIVEQSGPNSNGDSGNFATAYQRRWQAWLTDEELALEMAAAQAVRAASLLADTPLSGPTDLTDTSGNNRDWALVGAATFIAGPLPSVVTVSCTLTVLERETHEAIRFQRIFPHVSDSQFKVFCSRLEFEYQRGQGTITGQGQNSLALVSVSYDGGRTWQPERQLTMGKKGTYAHRMYTLQFRNSRDFVWKLVVTDPVLVAFLSAYGDFEGGTS